MTKEDIIRMAREVGWDINDLIDVFDFGVRLEAFANLVVAAEREACAEEPVAWNVIDPTGNILATEKNAIRGWARVNGYKLTVEGLLGLHELGWRVLPTSPPATKPEQEPSQWRDMVAVSLVREGIDKHKARELADHFAAQRPWQGLTDDDWDKVGDMPDTFDQGVAWAAARLKERNT